MSKLNAELINKENKEKKEEKKEKSLNSEQLKCINVAKSGKNLMVTGLPGSGKSFTLKRIIAALPSLTTFVTSTTGITAVEIGGVTLHSFMGCGLATGPVENIIKNGISPRGYTNIKNAKTLIIEEVSMLSGELFDKFDAIARHVRRCEKPWGGIQIILCGDMYQLESPEQDSTLIFNSECFPKCDFEIIVLDEIYRQREPRLTTLVRELAVNNLSDDSLKLIKELQVPLHKRPGYQNNDIKPTKLFPTKLDVKRINNRELDLLSGPQMHYEAVDEYVGGKHIAIDKMCGAVPTLYLRINAQVMLIKNDPEDSRLINGSRGVVIGFDAERHVPVVRFVRDGIIKTIEWNTWEIKDKKTGKTIATRTQIPLIHAWATTIHKSQGMSIDYLEADVTHAFGPGMIFVAISRATHIAGLYIIGFNPKKVIVNSEVVAFYSQIGASHQFGVNHEKGS